MATQPERDPPTTEPRASQGFPVVLGCVDAGSNGIRFAVASFLDPRTYTLLEYQRVPIRLGREVFLTGSLSPRTMEAALDTFRQFRSRLDTLGAVRCRAVATSAVREAENGPEFLEQIREQTGIELETITGLEEARLVHLAVGHRIPLGKTPWLMADLGGGSVEISLADADQIFWIESHNMGSVRLLEELSSMEHDSVEYLRLLEEYASTLHVPQTFPNPTAGYVATGGNIESLAKLANAIPDAQGISRLPMSDLRRLILRLARVPYKTRIEKFNLRPDRADVILPAAIVYERLGLLVGASEIHVPYVGVKDGLLLDQASDIAATPPWERRERQVEEAAIALGRKYQFDENHARQVAKLSLSLFDQTIELHGLGPDSRRILHVAALLHEIGSFVSRNGHHKHSLYLITASELLGFTPSEILVIGNVARYHRKGAPRPEHEAYQRLSKSDRQRTLKLAALLRLADSLDREHANQAEDVRVRVDKAAGEIHIGVVGKGDLLLEAWSLRKRSDLFREVFDLRVVLDREAVAAVLAEG